MGLTPRFLEEWALEGRRIPLVTLNTVLDDAKQFGYLLTLGHEVGPSPLVRLPTLCSWWKSALGSSRDEGIRMPEGM